MRSIKLILHNKTKVSALIGVLFSLFSMGILVPLWFSNYLPLSGIGYFFSENVIYSLITVLVLLYFIIGGVYYYHVKIDAYVIQVTSYRVVVDLLKEKDYIDIPHHMLINYELLGKPLSLNKTLIFKINTDSGKKITKRFKLTLVSKKEIKKIISALDSIMTRNK